jgi:ParB/RepB/Spo0J family partition protein
MAKKEALNPNAAQSFSLGALDEVTIADGFELIAHRKPRLKDIDVNLIDEASDVQARRSFDPDNDEADQELVQSVKEHGVLTPVHLRDKGNGRYQMMAGHRRRSAAIEAGQTEIRALIYPSDTPDIDVDILTYIENQYRKDLTLLENARVIKNMCDKHNWPKDQETARRLGISRAQLFRLYSVAEASIEVHKFLQAHPETPNTHVFLAMSMSNGKQLDVLQLSNAGATRELLEQAIERLKAGENVAVLIDEIRTAKKATAYASSTRSKASLTTRWADRLADNLAGAFSLTTSQRKTVHSQLLSGKITKPGAVILSFLLGTKSQSKADAIDLVAKSDIKFLKATSNFVKVVFGEGDVAPESQAALLRIVHAELAKLLSKIEKGANA